MQSEKSASNEEAPFAEDALWGAKAIANFLGRDERQTFYAIEAGHLPIRRIGRKILAFKSELTRHLRAGS